MNAEQWHLVKDIFGNALDVPLKERISFITDACHGDDEVRREVEKLVRSFDDEFMQDLAMSDVQREFKNECLEVGDVIAHYKVERRLGSGGMGEVYLAEDTQLDRLVALKILRHDSAFDPMAAKRLIREAKAAAALDHPNIGTVYEVGDADGFKFIAMQYLKGETLAEILSRGRIPVKQTVEIAIQIADALSHAHANRIIHRDIKPSNVMIDGNSKVKVLDFSLAKRSAVAGTESTESLFSRPGVIVGTVSYMSPEQARGNPVDYRTDIWSFGVLIYEMLTGRNPFAAATTSDTLVAILTADLPPTDGPALRIPERVRSVVRKAVEKDAANRYATIDEMLGDLRAISFDGFRESHLSEDDGFSFETTQRHLFSTDEIDGAVTADQAFHRETSEFHRPRSGALVGVAAGVLLVVVGLWYLIEKLRDANEPSPPEISQIVNWKRDLGEDVGGAARFSPDGKLVAFISTRNGISSVWLKQLGGGEPFPQRQDSWPEKSPLFSPDGDRIAFISERAGEKSIWLMPSLGGAPTFLSDIPIAADELIKWSRDREHIIFATRNDLFSLDVGTKVIERFANLDLSYIPETSFAISADEKWIAYTDKADGQRDIWLVSRDGVAVERVTNDDAVEESVLFHPDGRLIYDSVRDGITKVFIRAKGGEPKQLTSGEVAQRIVDVSLDGEKILVASERDSSDLWNLRIENSKETRLTDSLSFEFSPVAAPNLQSVVYHELMNGSDPLGESRLIIQELTPERGRIELPGRGYFPGFSPDGSQIAFIRSADGPASLWVTRTTGGEVRQLAADGVTVSGYGSFPFTKMQSQEYQWLPDGAGLVYCARRGGISNLWRASADGSGEVQLTSNTDSNAFSFQNPVADPSGNAIAFLRQEQAQEGKRRNRWSLWAHAAGRTRMLSISDRLMGIVGWSSDGDLIVTSFSSWWLPTHVELVAVSIDGGERRLVDTLDNTYPRNISISPDAGSIAYVKRENELDAIHVLTLSTGQDRKILESNDQRDYFASLAWAPDSKSIYFGKQANWRVLSIIQNFD